MNSDLVLKYLNENFADNDLLISKLLCEVDFRKGSFYTLFPSGIEERKIYEFESGGICPFRDSDEDEKSSIDINDELKVIIKEDLLNEESQNSIWIFEDALRKISLNMKNQEFFYENHLIYNMKDSVFYIIQKETSTLENISRCVDNTNIVWYYISILTMTPSNLYFGNELTEDQITFCCRNTKKLVFGAYDGEGYIFWEKKS